MVLDARITSQGGRLTLSLVLSRSAKRWLLGLVASVGVASGLSTSTIVDALHRAFR